MRAFERATRVLAFHKRALDNSPMQPWMPHNKAEMLKKWCYRSRNNNRAETETLRVRRGTERRLQFRELFFERLDLAFQFAAADSYPL